MKESIFRRMKDLSSNHLLGAGTPMCVACGNTGQQFSAGTSHVAKMSTSRGTYRYPGFKKDLFSLWTANQPAYVVTVIGAEPLDLSRKIEQAKKMKGPRLIITLSPCPTAWDYDPKETVAIGNHAVKTGVCTLKEFIAGKVTHTKIPRDRLPVEKYLKKQCRFAHLFTPARNDSPDSGYTAAERPILGHY